MVESKEMVCFFLSGPNAVKICGALKMRNFSPQDVKLPKLIWVQKRPVPEAAPKEDLCSSLVLTPLPSG